MKPQKIKPHGRYTHMHRWDDNIEINLRGTGSGGSGWI